MRILMLLTNGFDPDMRVHKEAASLAVLGHQVEIWCWDRTLKHRMQPSYDAYGYRVRRFFIRSGYGNGLKQLGAMFRYYMAVEAALRSEKPFDVVHCHDFDTLPLGCALKIRRGLRLVFDEHDFFYLYFSDRGFAGTIIANMIKLVQWIVLRLVDRHIVVLPAQMRMYAGKRKSYGPYLVMNLPDGSYFSDISKTIRQRLSIAYIGSVNYCAPVHALCKVASGYQGQVDIHIYGSGPCLPALTAKYGGLPNIFLHGEYVYSRINDIYRDTDISYAVYPTQISSLALPNKFFEGIMTCTPMIVNRKSQFGEIVLENEWGFGINEETMEEDLTVIFDNIIADPDTLIQMGWRMVSKRNENDWKHNEKILSAVYAAILRQ